MKAIVAVDSNWGIGYKGICFNVFRGYEIFRQMTLNKVVVMEGRRLNRCPEKNL